MSLSGLLGHFRLRLQNLPQPERDRARKWIVYSLSLSLARVLLHFHFVSHFVNYPEI